MSLPLLRFTTGKPIPTPAAATAMCASAEPARARTWPRRWRKRSTLLEKPPTPSSPGRWAGRWRAGSAPRARFLPENSRYGRSRAACKSQPRLHPLGAGFGHGLVRSASRRGFPEQQPRLRTGRPRGVPAPDRASLPGVESSGGGRPHPRPWRGRDHPRAHHVPEGGRRRGGGALHGHLGAPRRALALRGRARRPRLILGRGARLALALVLFEEALAQADRLRRDLGQLVLADEFHRVFECERDRRREQDRLVLARGADVGELLGLDRVDHQDVVAAVDADDHAFVHRLAGRDEHAAALLQLPQRVGDGLAVVLRHQHAVAVLVDLGLHRAVVVEYVAHDAGAAREGHELALEADQAARGDAVVEAYASLAVGLHVLQLAAAAAELFHYAALVGILHVDGQQLVGLALHAVDLF